VREKTEKTFLSTRKNLSTNMKGQQFCQQSLYADHLTNNNNNR
jgi:hypothetical protein